jgi:hypothetical protein
LTVRQFLCKILCGEAREFRNPCGGFAVMATNLGIDEKLLNDAVRIGKQRTKKATVNEALREYIDRRKRLKILDLFGKVDFDPQYDYKAERRKR